MAGCEKQVCTSPDMKLQDFRTAGLISLALWTVAAPAAALDVHSAVWQRFTLDSGTSAGLSFRGHSTPQLAPGLAPMIGLNYENAHLAGMVRNAWMEAGRVGAFAAGPVLAAERHIALSGRSQSTRDQDAALRFGGFLSYAESGQEFGRLTLTTGRTGGLDIKATRSFKLNDTVTLDIGPTISLGSFERFGYAQAARNTDNATLAGSTVNPDRAQLGAFGLATAIETRLGDRTVARMFADYARIEAQRGTPGLNARNRVDVGVSLTTRIGP
jgi:hypothetical protein